jgi:molybdopterin-binding protein
MNTLSGTIWDIETYSTLNIVRVKVEDFMFKIFTLELSEAISPGKQIQLLFKETAVIISDNIDTRISASNMLIGKVSELVKGELFSEVHLETSAGLFNSLITTDLMMDFGIRKNSEVAVFVKASDISLAEI